MNTPRAKVIGPQLSPDTVSMAAAPSSNQGAIAINFTSRYWVVNWQFEAN